MNYLLNSILNFIIFSITIYIYLNKLYFPHFLLIYYLLILILGSLTTIVKLYYHPISLNYIYSIPVYKTINLIQNNPIILDFIIHFQNLTYFSHINQQMDSDINIILKFTNSSFY